MEEKNESHFMALTVVLHRLLESGVVLLDERLRKVKPHQLNQYLRPLNYEAVKWPGTNEIILVDCDFDKERERKYVIVPPWTDLKVKEVKEVLTQLARGEPVNRTLLNFFTEMGYVQKRDDRICLTKRAILNFEQFLHEKNPNRFNRCEVCRLVVERGAMHEYCSRKVSKSDL